MRIITVYERHPRASDVEHRDLRLISMSYIRWFKISESLASLGYEVDMAIPDEARHWMEPNGNGNGNDGHVRRVPLSAVDWSRYDVVKTVFHRGFETLEQWGGADHPFIISKLGSVVGPRDMDGIYFYGETRKSLYETQRRIREASRFVTVLSPQAADLWDACHGGRDRLLLVPGGVDAEIPEPGPDPYPEDARPRALFAGNIYTHDKQPEANRVLVSKLNELGTHLAHRGARLYMIGVGDISALDPASVTWLGAVDYAHSWNYMHHAQAGVVVAAGPFNHNNESTKIYHYLRAGLPVVSEAGFPNDHVVRESSLGCVTESENMEAMADRVIEAIAHEWDRDAAIRYILDHHTWEKRVEVYRDLLRRHFRD
jgi:glycosyltransferase involved in cell wall biosynthesis